MARIQSVIDTVSREFVHSSADCVTSRHGTNYCCWNYACRPCILCTVTGIWQERTLWLRQSLNMYSRPIYTAALCWISSISTEVVEQLEYTDWRVYLREMQIQELHEARCVWRWFNAAVIGRVYNLQLPARVCYSQADKQKKHVRGEGLSHVVGSRGNAVVLPTFQPVTSVQRRTSHRPCRADVVRQWQTDWVT